MGKHYEQFVLKLCFDEHKDCLYQGFVTLRSLKEYLDLIIEGNTICTSFGKYNLFDITNIYIFKVNCLHRTNRFKRKYRLFIDKVNLKGRKHKVVKNK